MKSPLLKLAKEDPATGELRCIDCNSWFLPQDRPYGNHLCEQCYEKLGLKEEEYNGY
ncbi:MAG: hypothetical protein ACOCRO_00505 [Halanaerobiales bacterium]